MSPCSKIICFLQKTRHSAVLCAGCRPSPFSNHWFTSAWSPQMPPNDDLGHVGAFTLVHQLFHLCSLSCVNIITDESHICIITCKFNELFCPGNRQCSLAQAGQRTMDRAHSPEGSPSPQCDGVKCPNICIVILFHTSSMLTQWLCLLTEALDFIHNVSFRALNWAQNLFCLSASCSWPWLVVWFFFFFSHVLNSLLYEFCVPGVTKIASDLFIYFFSCEMPALPCWWLCVWSNGGIKDILLFQKLCHFLRPEIFFFLFPHLQ